MSGIDPIHHYFHAAIAPGVTEQPLLFACGEERLVGVVAHAREPRDTGVLIIVGGPQYRVGSHRQFVLLARTLAAAGYSNMRFDYRGMGDSEGAMRDFRAVEADIAAAAQAFRDAAPQVRRIVLFGLCDAASAALMYGVDLPDVAGLALFNPWVRDDVSLARAQVKHYYTGRLANPAFWRKLLGGGVDYRAACADFVRRMRTALTGRRTRAGAQERFQDRMARGWRNFHGSILLVLSGKDLTAAEFRDYVARDPAWQGLLERPNVMRVDIASADHTFSRAAWRAQVEQALLEWLHTLQQTAGVRAAC